MLKALPFAGLLFVAVPAHAQLETRPRFDALDRQLQMEDQRQLDQLESARQRERDRNGLPGSGVSLAELAMRDMDDRRERDRLLLKAEQDRWSLTRERMLAEAALLNKRVPAVSAAVVTSPERYILPPAPPGQFYARVDGRFVLVDRTSELVISVLPVQPTDPTADVPAGPRSLPDPHSAYGGLPMRRVSPTSALVIHDPATLALPSAPSGQFYARMDGRIVLVDARTELPVRVVRAG
jgi:Ni/Co efflux regulator RcnB